MPSSLTIQERRRIRVPCPAAGADTVGGALSVRRQLAGELPSLPGDRQWRRILAGTRLLRRRWSASAPQRGLSVPEVSRTAMLQLSGAARGGVNYLLRWVVGPLTLPPLDASRIDSRPAGLSPIFCGDFPRPSTKGARRLTKRTARPRVKSRRMLPRRR